MTSSIGFNLHDFFSIHLENPGPEEIRAVEHQIGVRPSALNGEPDLKVCYVERFDGQMCHIKMGKGGFIDDKFFVMAGNHKDYRVQFPFATLGQACELICETGITEIPLLNLIINLRILTKGLVPIHASAFVFDGIGVVVNGWPKGGKTSILFSFLAHGAQFISDDWLFADADGKTFGLMQPIQLSDWQIKQLPAFQLKLSRLKKWGLQGINWLDSAMQSLPKAYPVQSPLLKTFYKGLKHLKESQQHVKVSPEMLFRPEMVAPFGHFDVLLLALSQDINEVVIKPVPTQVAIERLLASLQSEWLQWEEYYLQYLYAFPKRPNMVMETSYSLQRELLAHLLKDKFVFAVHHPYRMPLDELYRAISPVLMQIKENIEHKEKV